MQLRSSMDGSVLILRTDTDRIDAANAIYLKDQFRDVTDGYDGRVVLDMTDITFVDSSGLGAIVSALKILKGRRLELAGLTPVVAKVFKLTQMDQVFTIHDQIADVKGSGADAA